MSPDEQGEITPARRHGRVHLRPLVLRLARLANWLKSEADSLHHFGYVAAMHDQIHR